VRGTVCREYVVESGGTGELDVRSVSEVSPSSGAQQGTRGESGQCWILMENLILDLTQG
jgi:hypothetical protein